MHIKNKKKITLFPGLALLVIGVGLIGYGILGLLQCYTATHDPQPKIETETITRAIDKPAETPLDDVCKNYKVKPEYPERITIPATSSGGCIERVGLDGNGAIAVPSSIYAVGWYVDSVPPGQPGLSIIDGHISGHYSDNGIFQKLYMLRAGDEYTVELGSGEILRYAVTDIQSVPLEDAAEAMMKRNPAIESQLNLITCAGKYDKKTKLYDKRVIVTSKLVPANSSLRG